MSWWSKFWFPKQAAVVSPVPLPPSFDAARAGFTFMRAFACGCGATIRIRRRSDAGDGPSNFTPFPRGHARAGQSQVSPGELTWNGLLEERGWTSQPVTCPACRCGMDVATYKQMRRELAEAEQLAATMARQTFVDLATKQEAMRRVAKLRRAFDEVTS